MPGRGPLVVGLLIAGCPGPAGQAFPEHVEMHRRAEYASGGGAALYVGRLQTNEGRAEFLRELDAHLVLLRQILDAVRRLDARPDVAGATQERVRLMGEAAQLGRLVREFLDLAVASKLPEVIPELEEALRMAGGTPPAPALDVSTLRERQRLLGTGPARCGAEQPDPLAGPHPPPPFFIMARDAVDEQGQEVQLDEHERERLSRIVNASRAQRQAMGLYGPFERITPVKGGETWRFRIGSVERGPGGAIPADHRVRAVLIDCEFDERGQLRGGRETVIDERGAPVRIS